MHASVDALCPACARPRSGGPECPQCGLIYARYKERPAAVELAERRVRLSLAQRERFFAGMASALESGLTPLAFVDTAAGALPEQLVASLRADQHGGLPLSATLRRLRILEGADLAFLQAGEIQGAVPASLRLLARRAADQRRDRGKVLLAVAYPLFLALGAVVIVPLPLVFRDGFGAYAARVVPLLGLFALAGLFALVLLPRMDREAAPRRFFRRLGLILPATSQALRNGSIGTFLDVLGGCIAAGLPVRQALPLAADAAPHPAFRGGEALRRIDDGRTLAEAVASVAIVPPATIAQIAQGETTGTLDRVLPALAADHRRRARVATVVAVVILALVAAGLVVAVLAWSIFEAWFAYFRQIEGAAQ